MESYKFSRLSNNHIRQKIKPTGDSYSNSSINNNTQNSNNKSNKTGIPRLPLKKTDLGASSRISGGFNEKQGAGFDLLNTVYSLYKNGKYPEAIGLCEKIIDQYPDEVASRHALIFQLRCMDSLKQSDRILNKLNQYSVKYSKSDISLFSESQKIPYYSKNKNFNEAVNLSKSIIKSCKDSTILKMIIFNLASLYNYNLKDKSNANYYYKEYLKKFPDDYTSEIIRSQLGIKKPAGELNFKKACAQHKPEYGSDIGNELYDNLLTQNYPNPFNPQTTISFSIKNESFVTLKVFDIMGKEVRTLINKNIPAGKYNAVFNSSNLSSGTYFYRLVIQPINGGKEVIMQKAMRVLK